MKLLVLLLLLHPVLHATIYRVGFVGRIDTVYTSSPYREDLEVGSIVRGSILIDSEAPDAQPTVQSFGGYQGLLSDVLVGARSFSRGGQVVLYDDFVFDNVRQDRVVIGAHLGAYGPGRDGSVILRFDELPLDTLDSVALEAALTKLTTLPTPHLVIHNDYTSPYTPYAAGTILALKVDTVSESTLSLLPLDAETLVVTRYRSSPGAGSILQRSHDLVEWTDLEPTRDSLSTFQWLETAPAERVFYRLKE